MRTLVTTTLALALSLASIAAESAGAAENMAVSESRPASGKTKLFSGIAVASTGLALLTAAPFVAYANCPETSEDDGACRARYAVGGLALAGAGAGLGVPLIIKGAKEMRQGRADVEPVRLDVVWAGQGPGAILTYDF